MADAHAPNGQNLLLNVLGSGQLPKSMSSLELVTLNTRQMAQVGEDIEIEVGTVGNEGMIGLPVFLGTDSTPGRAFSQVPGQAYRLSGAEFQVIIREPSRVTSVLHRYTQALMVQISQGDTCNRIHSNDQRCARWLLQTHDRVGRDEFQLTQEFLAQMLGARRAAVNEVAGRLQADGRNRLRPWCHEDP